MRTLESQRTHMIATSLASEGERAQTPDSLANLRSLNDSTGVALAYLAQTGLYYDHIDPLLELNGPGRFDQAAKEHLKSLASYSTELKNDEDSEALLPVISFPARIRMQKGVARIRFLGTSEGSSEIRASYKAFRKEIWVPLANRFWFSHWTLKTFDSIKLRLLARRQVQKVAAVRQPGLRFNQRAPFVFDCVVNLEVGHTYNPDWFFAIARLKTRYRWKLHLQFVESFPVKDHMLVIVPLLKMVEKVYVSSSDERNLILQWAEFLDVKPFVEGPNGS